MASSSTAGQNPRRRDSMPLTFPILPIKDIAELLRSGLGVQLAEQELERPTEFTARKVYNVLLELVMGVDRDRIVFTIKNKAEELEFSELYRDGLGLLTLFRELDLVCKAALFNDVRIDDITAPTAGRMQTILSAVLNFGRFREDVLRRHAEQSELLQRTQEEYDALVQHERELAGRIKALKERLAKDAPIREELMGEIEAEETQIRALQKDKDRLEKQVEDAKREIEELNNRCTTLSMDSDGMQMKIKDLESQLVSSPNRIKGEIAKLKTQLEEERAQERDKKEHERVLVQRKQAVEEGLATVDVFAEQVGTIEEQMTLARKLEEEARSKKAANESHSFRIDDLRQQEQDAANDLDEIRKKGREYLGAKKQQRETLEHHRSELRRELENRKLNATESVKRTAKVREDAERLRLLISKAKREHQDALAQKQAQLDALLGSFDAYVENVTQGVQVVREAAGVLTV